MNGRKALLRVARVNCAECGACGLLARNREQVMEFTVTDNLGASPGDEVILSVPSRKLYLAYLTMFGLPVLVIAAAYFTVAALCGLMGVESVQGPGVITAVVAGLVAFWGGIKLAERLGLSPRIIEIARTGDAAESEEGEPGDGADE